MIINRIKTILMRRLTLVALAAFLSFTAPIHIAYAAPIAKIKLSTATPVVGQVVAFDGSASICDNPTGCSYTWKWFWRSPDGTTTYVGGLIGQTRTVRYAFGAFAATKPYVIVTLTVSAGRVIKSSTASVAFRVLP